MKKLILFVALFITYFAQAQEIKQVVKGRVFDEDNNAGLPSATIIVLKTDPAIGATTDLDGYFRIEGVPVGRHSIQVSYVGYEPVIIPEILVGSAKEVVLSIPLTEQLSTLQEVVIKPQEERGSPLNDMALMSAKSFSVEETQRYAVSINDPSRMALNFAGVSSAGEDGSNEIVIRGNSPNGLLWRIEGMEVPPPNHFADEGFSGGFVSILNSNMMGTSDFLTGAFPAEFVNAYSGVFDINLRKGNTETREYAFQVGVLGIDFTLEGPMSKNTKSSYLLNYRYSTIALLNNAGIDISGDDATYQDGAFKFYFPTKKIGTFSVWGLGGNSSSIDPEVVYDKLLWEEDPWSRYNSESYSYMAAGGVTHEIFLDDNSFLRSIISVSGNGSRNYESKVNDDLVNEEVYHDRIERLSTRAAVMYNSKINSSFTTRFGVVFNQLGFDFFSKDLEDEGKWIVQSDAKGGTQLLQFYNQNKYRINKELTFNFGLSYSFFAQNQSHYIEPKLALKWQMSPKHAFGISAGLYSRNEDLPAYFMQIETEEGDYVTPNEHLGLKKSAQGVISYNYLISKNLRLKTEVYYQHLYGIFISTDNNSTFSTLNGGWNGSSRYLTDGGLGRNYGVELTLERYFSNAFYFLVTTSLFDSKYQAADGDWYNTRYNGRYVANVVAGKEFYVGKKQKNVLAFNVKVTVSGGERYTPVDEEATKLEEEIVFLEEKSFEEQAKTYFRTDIGTSYRINKPKVAHIISLDIQNVTNRENEWYRYYNLDREKIESAYHWGMIPIFNYRLEF